MAEIDTTIETNIKALILKNQELQDKREHILACLAKFDSIRIKVLHRIEQVEVMDAKGKPFNPVKYIAKANDTEIFPVDAGTGAKMKDSRRQEIFTAAVKQSQRLLA